MNVPGAMAISKSGLAMNQKEFVGEAVEAVFETAPVRPMLSLVAICSEAGLVVQGILALDTGLGVVELHAMELAICAVIRAQLDKAPGLLPIGRNTSVLS